MLRAYTGSEEEENQIKSSDNTIYEISNSNIEKDAKN